MPIYVLRKLQLVSWNYRVRCKKIYFLHLLSLIGKQSLFFKSIQREHEMFLNWMIITSVNFYLLLMCWKQDMFLIIVLEKVLVKLELDSFVQIRKQASHMLF